MITQTFNGGYEPVVKLEDNSLMHLAQYVKELEAEMLAPGTVAFALQAENQYHPLLASVNSPASEAWYSESSPASGIRTLYVPSAEQLGFNPAEYKLQAKARAICLDQLATSDNVSIRLLDVAADTVVAGSAATGALNGQNVQQAIESAFFDITPGKAYFADAKKHDDNSSNAAAFARQELIIRIVKL